MTQVNKVLLDNGKVQITTINEVDRYRGYAAYATYADSVIEDFKECCKIWTTKTSREGFDGLDTKENWEPDGNNVVEDIQSFQKYLDDTYGSGKYEAYSLGAYIHTNVSFSFNKGEDTRCRWDSGTVGFIGVPKEGWYTNLSKAVSDLNDAWNGWIVEYTVFDDYEDELIDCCDSLDDNLNGWKQEMTDKYGINWKGIEPHC